MNRKEVFDNLVVSNCARRTSMPPTNTDYFPILATLADEQNEIDADILNNGKPLDELLAKKFKLSRPTIRELLSKWEKEGSIKMERNTLRGFINKILILNPFPRKRVAKNKALVLLDLDNLYINFGSRTIIRALDTTLKKIAQEVGAISKAFVFIPYQNAQLFGEELYRAGFIPILCPEIRSKNETNINTTDQMLTDLGKELIEGMPEITHLCLGSGDVDFSSGDVGFPSLLQKAEHYGLHIIVIAGNINSLSSELIKKAGLKPDTKEKMVYILPKPEEKDQ